MSRKANPAFILIIAMLLFLFLMNMHLNSSTFLWSPPSPNDPTTDKFRHLSSEEEVDHLDQAERTKLRKQHFGSSNGKNNGGKNVKDIEQRHLYRWRNPSTGLRYKNRWIHRFRQATRRNKLGGMFLFRHIRKVSSDKSSRIMAIFSSFFKDFSFLGYIFLIFKNALFQSQCFINNSSLFSTLPQFSLVNNPSLLGRRHIPKTLLPTSHGISQPSLQCRLALHRWKSRNTRPPPREK